MRNKVFAALALVPVVASSGLVIAQPTEVPKTEKENVQKIQEVVLMQLPKEGPTKDEIAQKQILERQAELAKQAEAENLKKQEEQRKAEEAAKVAKEAAIKAATANASYNVEQWRPIVAKYPWPVDQAMLVMARESGGNPRAVSATDDHGLFQIHSGLANYGQAIYDPETNVKIAYGMYASRGWRPWYAVQGILW